MSITPYQIIGNLTFFNSLWDLTTMKISKLHITGPLWKESSPNWRIPPQRASTVETIAMVMMSLGYEHQSCFVDVWHHLILAVSFRVTPPALGQSHNCCSACEAGLKAMGNPSYLITQPQKNCIFMGYAIFNVDHEANLVKFMKLAIHWNHWHHPCYFQFLLMVTALIINSLQMVTFGEIQELISDVHYDWRTRMVCLGAHFTNTFSWTIKIWRK